MKKRDLAVALVIACVACSKPDAPPPAASASAAPPPVASSVAPSNANPKMGGHGMRGGTTSMFLKASDSLTLPADKKASVDKIEASLKPEADDSSKGEMKALHTELLAQVKAGKIDQTKLDPHLAALEKDVQAKQDKEAAALNDLHALLDPAQRKALAAEVRTKNEQRDARMAKFEPSKDDWAKRRLEYTTKALTLDDAQQKKVQAIIEKKDNEQASVRPEMKKQMDALVTAFEADTFDAKKQEAFTAPAKRARAGAAKEVSFLSQLVPVLTPEQREKLTATLEKRSEHIGKRPGQALPPLFMEEMHEDDHH
jgi:Spy/CpxP family protein refolding chaperone